MFYACAPSPICQRFHTLVHSAFIHSACGTFDLYGFKYKLYTRKTFAFFYAFWQVGATFVPIM